MMLLFVLSYANSSSCVPCALRPTYTENPYRLALFHPHNTALFFVPVVVTTFAFGNSRFSQSATDIPCPFM